MHIGIPGAQPDIGLNTRSEVLGFTESGRKVRQAIQAAVNAEDIMKGYGDPRLWQLCPSLQMCGTPWAEHTDNAALYNQNNPELAKQLLEEAGYMGEEIIILDPTDFPTIHPIAPVLKEQLSAVGINATVKSTDWAGPDRHLPWRPRGLARLHQLEQQQPLPSAGGDALPRWRDRLHLRSRRRGR